MRHAAMRPTIGAGPTAAFRRHRPKESLFTTSTAVWVKWPMAILVIATECIFLALASDRGFDLIAASLLMTIVLLLQVAFAVPENWTTPTPQVVLIFNWLFMDLAPKVQIVASRHVLVNTMQMDTTRAAETFLVCAAFALTYTMAHAWLVSHRPLAAPPPRRYETVPDRNVRGVAVMMLVGLSFLCTVGGLPFALKASVGGEMGPVDMVVRKFILFIPCASLLVVVDETARCPQERRFSRYMAIGFLLMLVLITQNTHTEKRHALGSIYLSLMLVAMPALFRTVARKFWLLMAGMVVVFPLASLWTHQHHGGTVDLSNALTIIEEHYISIHYDAWSNVFASIEIAQRQGLEWGHQLLGVIAFYVPSSVWPDKPPASGIFIANYLMAHYAMWFTNLSSPLVAEAVLDFGPVGVVPYAIVVALVLHLLERAGSSLRVAAYPRAIYYAVFMMFVLRGSLMVAVAYGAGAIAAFGVVAGVFRLAGRIASRRRRSPAALALVPVRPFDATHASPRSRA